MISTLSSLVALEVISTTGVLLKTKLAWWNIVGFSGLSNRSFSILAFTCERTPIDYIHSNQIYSIIQFIPCLLFPLSSFTACLTSTSIALECTDKNDEHYVWRITYMNIYHGFEQSTNVNYQITSDLSSSLLTFGWHESSRWVETLQSFWQWDIGSGLYRNWMDIPLS